MRFLLDTNIASFAIRGANEALLTRLQSQPIGSVGISAITEAELLHGLARKPGAMALSASVHAFLRHVTSVAWDSDAAACYGPLRANLEAAGTPLGAMDTLIAAHAMVLKATLVTNDQAFRRVPGLMVEDWSAG
jgi:tRNA(fMet)-specific endonuclease VapC